MSQDQNWADYLPLDVLCCIASRLPLADFVRFSAVCKSWYSVAAASDHLAPRMPYLLIPGNGNDQGSAEHCNLLNLTDNTLLRISTLPEIRGKQFVGSQDGWVIMIDEFSNVSLLNPLTRSIIDLPLITTFSHIDPIYDESGSLVAYCYHLDRIWKNGNEPECLSIEEFHDNSFCKVVLSSSPSSGSDYTVVAIFNFTGLILFIRPGDNKWVLLEEDKKDWFLDVIYWEGKFLALAKSGFIVELDVASDPARKILVAKEFEHEDLYEMRYLVVDCAGDLLQVCRDGNFTGEGRFYILDKVLIMKLDKKHNTWSPVKNLGKQSLFLGNSYSLALSAEEIPGLKENCIYFTDDDLDMAHDIRNNEIRDVVIFNVEDGTIQLCNPPLDIQLKWPPPVWVAPTLQ